jgi:hypothetical protein
MLGFPAAIPPVVHFVANSSLWITDMVLLFYPYLAKTRKPKASRLATAEEQA